MRMSKDKDKDKDKDKYLKVRLRPSRRQYPGRLLLADTETARDR